MNDKSIPVTQKWYALATGGEPPPPPGSFTLIDSDPADMIDSDGDRLIEVN